jgi:uncharacterized membrane protein
MKNMIKRAFKYFGKGLLVLLPLLGTAYILTALFRLIERTAIDWVVVFIPERFRVYEWVVGGTEAVTAVVLFGMLAGLGLIASTLFGKRLVGFFEGLVNAIPVVKNIYQTIRQAVDLIGLRKTMGTMHPVLVEYPTPGLWAIGFITGPWEKRLSPNPDVSFVTVFIPTTPNPTSGFLTVVPLDKVRPIDVPVESVLKMILTGGMVKQ